VIDRDRLQSTATMTSHDITFGRHGNDSRRSVFALLVAPAMSAVGLDRVARSVPPAHIDETRIEVAFGRGAVPKLHSELQVSTNVGCVAGVSLMLLLLLLLRIILSRAGR
jgi:hypothetical protein